MILRWIHFISATGWLGSLYYLHLFQGDFFDKAGPDEKTLRILRVTSTLTLITGVAYILTVLQLSFRSSWGVGLLTGSALAVLMWVNTFFFLDPNKFGNEKNVSIVARMTAMISFPMLYYMGAASHHGYTISPDTNLIPLLIAFLVIVTLVEVNAFTLGLGSHMGAKAIVGSGIVLTLVMEVFRYVLISL